MVPDERPTARFFAHGALDVPATIALSLFQRITLVR
jgi:hypothetical protein